MSVTFQSPAPVSAPAARGAAPTPRLELSVGTALARYLSLASALPGTAIHYAVKANPHPVLLRALAQAGCRSTSPAPPRCGSRSTRVPRHPTSCTPTRSRAATTSPRRTRSGCGCSSSTPRGRSTSSRMPRRARRCSCGSSPPARVGLAAVAQVRLHGRRGRGPARGGRPVGPRRRRGLVPRRLAAARPRCLGGPDRVGRPGVRRRARAAGLHPWLLDLGGGFPARLDGEPLPVADYGRAIDAQLTAAFGADRPRTLVEPGRGVVGDAGTVVTSVVGVVDRGGTRWVFVDAGVFTGLVETLDEAIRYRLETPGVGGPTGPVRARRPDVRQRGRALRDDAGAGCRCRSPRATSCGSTPPAPTPRATRPSASTGSHRCPPSSPADRPRPRRRSAGAVEDGAHAHLVAVGVGEHGERRCLGVVDHGAPGGDGGGDARLGRLGRHPHVEVPALPGRLVWLGALEPGRRQAAGGVDHGVVARRRRRRR